MKDNPDLGTLCGCPIYTNERAISPAEEVANGIGYRYFSCPHHFIPESILLWYREYSFFKKFPNAKMPEYGEISPRWIECAETYEYWVEEKTEEFKATHSVKQ